MGLVRNVAKNSLAMAGVQIVAQISTLILAMVLSRSLGADYATYTSAFSVATVLFLIADFGLGFQMVVEVAPNRSIAPQFLTNTLVLRALLGTVAMGLTLAMVLMDGLPATVSYAYLIIAVSTAFSWIAQTFQSMFNAFERMYYILMTSLVERAFTVSISIALVLLGYGLELVVLVVLVGSILNVCLAYLVCSRLVVRPSRVVNLGKIKAQLKDALTYAVNSALVSSLYALNGFLLLTIVWGTRGIEAGELANAQFYIAFNLVVSLIAIPTVFKTALLPVISRLYSSSRDLARLTQQKTMKYMFALGLPITVGGIILADKIIMLFFPNYPASAGVFQVLIPVIAISFFGTGVGSVLASAKMMRYNTVSASLGAGLNILLCFALIPYMEAQGAALAFTLATLTTNMVSYYYLTRKAFAVDAVDIIVRPVLAAGGMAAVLLLMPGADFIVSLGVGAAVYFVLLFAVKAIDQEDAEILKKVMKKGA